MCISTASAPFIVERLPPPPASARTHTPTCTHTQPSARPPTATLRQGSRSAALKGPALARRIAAGAAGLRSATGGEGGGRARGARRRPPGGPEEGPRALSWCGAPAAPAGGKPPVKELLPAAGQGAVAASPSRETAPAAPASARSATWLHALRHFRRWPGRGPRGHSLARLGPVPMATLTFFITSQKFRAAPRHPLWLCHFSAGIPQTECVKLLLRLLGGIHRAFLIFNLMSKI